MAVASNILSLSIAFEEQTLSFT